ncbi:DUF3667 domain-containing protein [Dokdonia sp. Hel_I_53]|uniref:DUF3667 domain-containing protein n=1 Tax=Dokdonia sp. Hel_I_53 TaxID=1566287 RepID=UPI00119B8709|nr:DUF3667 domain-containing protein [Dokdonia sp. Hel_I_53]TVZ50968.1 uncharacterized protein DUF3667 [Dokdonia sp. Hel_I_53]
MSRKLTKKERKELKKKNNLLEVKETCVNCNQFIALDQRFCTHCGGKRIYNRLTWRNLIEDFLDRFLNLENSFLKTFVAMFRRPEDVIGGYINGMRKKYLPAFSYFAIAISLTGFYYFLLQGWFFDTYIDAQTQLFSESMQEPQVQIQQDLTGALMENQSLYMFLIIPILALMSRVVFWNYKQYNLVEHFVIFLYTYSHISIVSVILQILFIWSSSLLFFASIIVMLFMLFFSIYVLKRLFSLDAAAMILKTSLFFIILSLFMCLIISPVIVYGIKTVIAHKEGKDVNIDESTLMGKFLKTSIEQAERQKRKDSIKKDSIKRVERFQKVELDLSKR